MNRKQRRRRHARRLAHHASARTPRNVISRASYSKVKKGHIVPVSYQRNFAVDEQVAVHIDGREDCVALSIRDAATRSAFYRRTRPDGTEIDDIEASLSFTEAAASPAFTQLVEGEPLTEDRKNVLAQFFGVQVVRGPAYFEQRGQLLDGIVASLGAAEFRPSAVRHAGGDVEVVRRQVREAYRCKTAELTEMLTVSLRMSAVLGSMRWHLLSRCSPTPITRSSSGRCRRRPQARSRRRSSLRWTRWRSVSRSRRRWRS